MKDKRKILTNRSALGGFFIFDLDQLKVLELSRHAEKLMMKKINPTNEAEMSFLTYLSESEILNDYR